MQNDERFEFTGNYRAIVEDNNDPLDLGRIRVRIIGMHSLDHSLTPVNNLPFAEPCLSLYYSGGQNLTNGSNINSGRYSPDNTKFDPPQRTTEDFLEKYQDPVMKKEGSGGIFTVPRKGTQVWVFFDAGNHMRPQYWAAAPKKADWIEQRNKLKTEIELKRQQITSIRSLFLPDNSIHSGSGASSEAKVSTKVNKPRLQIIDLEGVKNSEITSFTSPGGVTYIIVNTEGREKTYIIHKGTLEYIDDKGQKKTIVGLTDGKANDLEQAVANNYELHIGGDFDVYVKKSHFIQVDGDSQIVVKGNAGIFANKDIDLVSNSSINIDAKKNINLHAGQDIQYQADGNMLGKVNGDYDLSVSKTHNIAVSLSAKFSSLDLHIKARTNQIFEAAAQQTMVSNIFLGKGNSLYSINSEALTRINAGAAIQTAAATIDLAGVAVNVGGVVMLGSAVATPAPVITPPTTDASTVVSKKKFSKTGTDKSIIENPSN